MCATTVAATFDEWFKKNEEYRFVTIDIFGPGKHDQFVIGGPFSEEHIKSLREINGQTMSNLKVLFFAAMVDPEHYADRLYKATDGNVTAPSAYSDRIFRTWGYDDIDGVSGKPVNESPLVSCKLIDFES